MKKNLKMMKMDKIAIFVFTILVFIWMIKIIKDIYNE